MEQLMLINPAHRPKRRRHTARKGVMPAGLASYHAKRRAAKTHARRRNPLPAINSLKRVSRARRRNPVATGGLVMPVVQGAAGALIVNYVGGMLPLPAALSTGMGKRGVNLALALALGLVGKRFMGRAAAEMAKGSMIVTATQAVSDLLGQSVPGLTLSGVGAIPAYRMGAITEEVTPQRFLAPNRSASIQRNLAAIPTYA